MKIEGFLNMIPPTTTHQNKKLGVRNNKPFMYDHPKLKEVKQEIKNHLFNFKPEKPFSGALVLDLTILYKSKKGQPNGTPYLKKPDWDNAAKTFQDCMADLGFMSDDCKVFDGRVRQFYNDQAGIFFRLEQIKGNG